MPRLDAWVILTVRDPDGRVVRRRRFRSRSYLLAMLDILSLHMQSTTPNIVDTGGVTRSGSTVASDLFSLSGVGITTFGIRVGTGSTAVAIADYALGTPIAEGTGSGQLTHQATTATAPETSSSTRRFHILRNLINSSGGSITVREVGIYARVFSALYYACIIRDVVAGGQVVLDGQTLTVDYVIGVSA